MELVFLMKGEVLRKLRKCDPKELLLWVSASQLPPVNRERAAIIEYALGVLVSLGFEKTPKRRVSRELIRRVFLEAYTDFENFRESPKASKLQAFFPLGFLGIRGEAFPWQFAQAALDRYGCHNEWMIKHLGFTIFDAVYFSKEIMKYSLKRALRFSYPSFPPFTKEEYYDPKYVLIPPKDTLNFWKASIIFSKKELESLFLKEKHEKLNNYLKRMSVCLGDKQSQMKSPLDFNILTARPFVKVGQDFILLIPRLLWYALSTTFHFDFLSDVTYRGKYIDEKGKIAEKRMIMCFSKIFAPNNLFPRVRYNKHKGSPDVDLVIREGSTLMFVECTAKWITRNAKKGDPASIMNDLRASVEKCTNQISRALQSYREGKLEIPDLYNVKRLLPVIVVDDYIPGLDLILKFCDFLRKIRPYIINIYDLDIITDLINKKDFIDFVAQRIELSKAGRIFAADEIDYFVLYRMHGFEKYARLLEERRSELHYIGHLENIYPNYYKEHFMKFIDDPVLTNLIEFQNLDWEIGWS